MDESRGGIEADRQALLAGRETEPETDVRLASAGVADRDDVLPAGHILRAGELQHEDLVERRNGGKVEAVQALHGREPRLLDPTLHHAPFALDQLQFGQPQQKADMIEALGGALPSQLVGLAQELRQLERLQMMREQKLGRDAIARGAIGFDAVKHLVLCRIVRRPPRLDMTVSPYLPKAHVAMTLAKTYLGLLTAAAS